MANKKYTLYFRGKNKYGHNHDIPILSLNLKELDMYTSNYIDYVDLFNNLPINVSSFIKNELGFDVEFDNNDDLERSFYITDNDFNPIMDIIFEKDIDVLYVEPKELSDLICKVKMKFNEFQGALLKLSNSKVDKIKYEFFKYLYFTYVKNEPILSMIDTYEVIRNFGNLDYDNAFIAAIATDDTNIKILSKKLSQTIESRRNLAFCFKNLFESLGSDGKLIDYSSMIERKNNGLDLDYIFDEINEDFIKYKRKYEKEYETTHN